MLRSNHRIAYTRPSWLLAFIIIFCFLGLRFSNGECLPLVCCGARHLVSVAVQSPCWPVAVPSMLLCIPSTLYICCSIAQGLVRKEYMVQMSIGLYIECPAVLIHSFALLCFRPSSISRDLLCWPLLSNYLRWFSTAVCARILRSFVAAYIRILYRPRILSMRVFDVSKSAEQTFAMSDDNLSFFTNVSISIFLPCARYWHRIEFLASLKLSC